MRKANEEEEKYLRYAAIISAKLAELFEEDGELYGDEDLPNSLTEFIHALATVAPCHLHNNITGDDKNHLEFNHLCNQLCFQYARNEELPEDGE